MQVTSQISEVLQGVLAQLPSLMTVAGCMVFVLTRWKRYPKVALPAFISLALIFLCGSLLTVLFILIRNSLFDGRNRTTNDIATVLLFVRVIYNIGVAIAFAPLLAAIFIHRAPLQQRGAQRFQ